jgi:hypothetical protein
MLMRSRLLTLVLILLLASSGTMLAQGKGQGKGKGKDRGQETAEVKRAQGAKKAGSALNSSHGKAHELHVQKKGATKGKKKGQQGTTPGKGPVSR